MEVHFYNFSLELLTLLQLGSQAVIPPLWRGELGGFPCSYHCQLFTSCLWHISDNFYVKKIKFGQIWPVLCPLPNIPLLTVSNCFNSKFRKYSRNIYILNRSDIIQTDIKLIHPEQIGRLSSGLDLPNNLSVHNTFMSQNPLNQTEVSNFTVASRFIS